MSENRRPGPLPRDLANDPPHVPAPPPPRGNGEIVTVACNISNGVILSVYKMLDIHVDGFGGGRDMKRAQTKPGSVTIAGNAVNLDAILKGLQPPVRSYGYALTPNVPRDFWEEWLAQNADCDYVRNHCIFADTHARVEAKCKEMRGVQSGLEPIDPKNPSSKSRELQGLRMKVHQGTRDES